MPSYIYGAFDPEAFSQGFLIGSSGIPDTNLLGDFEQGNEVGIFIDGLPYKGFPKGIHKITDIESAGSVRKFLVNRVDVPNFVSPSLKAKIRGDILVDLLSGEAVNKFIIDTSKEPFLSEYTNVVSGIGVDPDLYPTINIYVSLDLLGKVIVGDSLSITENSVYIGDYVVVSVVNRYEDTSLVGLDIAAEYVGGGTIPTTGETRSDVVVQVTREVKSVITNVYLPGLVVDILADDGSGNGQIRIKSSSVERTQQLVGSVLPGVIVLVDSVSPNSVIRTVQQGNSVYYDGGSQTVVIKVEGTLVSDESTVSYNLRIMDPNLEVLTGFDWEDGSYGVKGIIPRESGVFSEAGTDKMVLDREFHGVRNSIGALVYGYLLFKVLYVFIGGKRSLLGHLLVSVADHEPEVQFEEATEVFATRITGETESGAIANAIVTKSGTDLKNIRSELNLNPQVVLNYFSDKIYICSRNVFNIMNLELDVLLEVNKKTIVVTSINIAAGLDCISVITSGVNPASLFSVGDFVTMSFSSLNGQYKVKSFSGQTVFLYVGVTPYTWIDQIKKVTIAPVNKFYLNGDRRAIIANNKAVTPVFGGLLYFSISGTKYYDGSYTCYEAFYDLVTNMTALHVYEAVGAGSVSVDDTNLSMNLAAQTLTGVVDEIVSDDGFGRGLMYLKAYGNIALQSLKDIINNDGSIKVPVSSSVYPITDVEMDYAKNALKIIFSAPLSGIDMPPGSNLSCVYYYKKGSDSVDARLTSTGTTGSSLAWEYLSQSSGLMETILPGSIDDGTEGMQRTGVIGVDLSGLRWKNGIPQDLIFTGVVTSVTTFTVDTPPRGKIFVNNANLVNILSVGDVFHLYDSTTPNYVEGDYIVYEITTSYIKTTVPIRGSDYSGPPINLAIGPKGYYLSLERRNSSFYQPPILKSIGLVSSERVFEDSDGELTGKVGNKFVVLSRPPAALVSVTNNGPVGMESCELLRDLSIVSLNTRMPERTLGKVEVSYKTLNIPYVMAKVFVDYKKIYKIDGCGLPDLGGTQQSQAKKFKGYDFYIDNLGFTGIPVSIVVNLNGHGRIEFKDILPDSILEGDRIYLRLVDDDGKNGYYTVDSVEGKEIILKEILPGANLQNPNAEAQVFIYERLNGKQRAEWRSILADIIQHLSAVSSIGTLSYERPSPNEDLGDFVPTPVRNESFRKTKYLPYRRI